MTHCTKCAPETFARPAALRYGNANRTPSWTAGTPFATPQPSPAAVRSRAPSRWLQPDMRCSIASPRIARSGWPLRLT